LIQIGVSSLIILVPSKPSDSLLYAPARLAASESDGLGADELTETTAFSEPTYVTITL
jgi:hypothetical protein